jgi:hypothetical protein
MVFGDGKTAFQNRHEQDAAKNAAQNTDGSVHLFASSPMGVEGFIFLVKCLSEFPPVGIIFKPDSIIADCSRDLLPVETF